MKCPNCGAELKDNGNAKFCQYCGKQIEKPQHTPETIPGAIYGIAKGVVDEVGKQLDYNRANEEKIEERKIKRERENLRQALWILLVAVALLGGIIAFCMHMAEKEKQTAPVSMNYTVDYEIASKTHILIGRQLG